MNAVSLTFKEGMLSLRGEITFSNAEAWLKEGNRAMDEHPEIRIDLKELSRCDSSGLAVLTAWAREANKQGKLIQFIEVPQFVQNIAGVYGLKEVLPELWEN